MGKPNSFWKLSNSVDLITVWPQKTDKPKKKVGDA